MPSSSDPYEQIDAPQYADLSAEAAVATMSPNTTAWFPRVARESVPTPPPPPPPPREVEEVEISDAPSAFKQPTASVASSSSSASALRVPAAATKVTKSAQARAAEVAAAKAAAAEKAAAASASATAAHASAMPAPVKKPIAPVLASANRRLGQDMPKPTTEERQMLEAARAMREKKEEREKWRQQLDKVLQNTGAQPAPPARALAKPTVPKEFTLSSPRRVNAAPASAASTPASSSRPSNKTTPSNKPLAESVSEFTKTPKRFRGKAANAAPSPMPAPRSATVTKPSDVHLISDERAAMRGATAPKSSVERELEYISSVPKFKARPVSKKVLESSGDLGVPRVPPRQPTRLAEFSLSTSLRSKQAAAASKDDDAASDAGSTASAPARYTFKARPIPKGLMDGTRAGLAQVTPRKITKPSSPKLSTSARAELRPPPEAPKIDEPEQFAAFKARPMPDMSASPSPLKAPGSAQRPLTEPRPFNLASLSRHELAEATRQQTLLDQQKREELLRRFKAKPMPVTDKAWQPTVAGKATTPVGFELTTDTRSELHKAQLEQKLGEVEAERKARAAFKARAPNVLSAPAFAPQKSKKPLTEIASSNIPFSKTVEQGKKRRELEMRMQAKRAAMEAAAEEKAKADAAAAARDLAALRKTLVHKARPANVLRSAPFVVQKAAARTLTVPKSPAFATTSRVKTGA